MAAVAAGNRNGMTLGELIDFVKQCTAFSGFDRNSIITAKTGWDRKLTEIRAVGGSHR